MGSMPLALSVHNFISSVGADVGFASIIGLAILVLLYFSQAKETANLREEAEELAHRLHQAETRLAQVGRQPVAAPPPITASPQQSPRPDPESPIRAARAPAPSVAVPSAPAGMAAPALAAATRVVPVASPPAESSAPAEHGEHGESNEDGAAREPAVAQQAEPVGAVHAEELAAPAAASAMAASAPVRVRPGPGPATAAGGANGGGRDPRLASPVAARSAVASPRERVQIRPGTAQGRRQPPPAPRAPAKRQGGPGRRFALLIGALIAIAAIVVLVIVTQSGGGTPSHAAAGSTTNAPGSSRHRAGAGFSPSSVTVAVLNGTATNDLAHRVASKLASSGYKQGTVVTAPNQTQSATVVAYLPGFRNDALHVATSLKLGPAAVQPIDQNTQAVACPPPSSCSTNVVVTVGQDLSTL